MSTNKRDMKKRKKKTLHYQKGVVKLPHMAPMRADELEYMIWFIMRSAETYIECSGRIPYQLPEPGLVNLLRTPLVFKQVFEKGKSHGSHKQKKKSNLCFVKRLLSNRRARLLHRIPMVSMQRLLDDELYPKLLR